MQVVASLLLLAAFPHSVAAGEHPIDGVISLLQKLEIQSKEEGAAEAASFQKFTYWCKTSEKTLSKAIKTEKKDISSLTDKIEGLTSDIESLTSDIAALKADIEEMETASDKAKTVRDDEKDLYDEEQKNFEDTITAIDEAITTLKDSKASLLQTGAKKAVEKAQALAQAMGKPAAKTYSFKSGGIIETFKAMKAEFEADKLDSTTAETNKLNAYNLAKQARDTALDTAKESKKEHVTAELRMRPKVELELFLEGEKLARAKNDIEQQLIYLKRLAYLYVETRNKETNAEEKLQIEPMYSAFQDKAVVALDAMMNYVTTVSHGLATKHYLLALTGGAPKPSRS